MGKKKKKEGEWNGCRVAVYAMLFLVTLGIITPLLAWATDGRSFGSSSCWSACALVALIPPIGFHLGFVK